MKTVVASNTPAFTPKTIAVTVETQEELDALHRMARTGLAKERMAAGTNGSSSAPAYVIRQMRASGYGTEDGVDTVRAFFGAVIEAGGK